MEKVTRPEKIHIIIAYKRTSGPPSKLVVETLSGVDHFGAKYDVFAGDNLVQGKGAIFVRIHEFDEIASFGARVIRILRIHVQLELRLGHSSVCIEIDHPTELALTLLLPILD